jgi:hypothetical protein
MNIKVPWADDDKIYKIGINPIRVGKLIDIRSLYTGPVKPGLEQ